MVPEAFIPKKGARVMSLQEPTKKMSKSDENPNNYISLLDAPEIIKKKIKRAVTDSEEGIIYDPNRPGLANLLTIFSILSDQPMAKLEEHFVDKGYAHLKDELGDLLVSELEPVQKRYQSIMNDKSYLESVLKKGAGEAQRRARKTLSKVYRKMGLVEAPR